MAVATAIRHRIPRGAKVGVRAMGGTVIDRILDVDTAGRVDLRGLGLGDSERVGYEAGGWLDLRRVLRPGEVSGDDVFLDLGSGKGRIVLAAARLPFRRVVGVELSEELNAVARRNLATFRLPLRCGDVDLVTADAVDYGIPDDVTVVYLFNPFRGRLFDAVVDHLAASIERRPRVVRLVYRNTIHHEALMRTGRCRLLRTALGVRPGREWREATAIRLYTLCPSLAGDGAWGH